MLVVIIAHTHCTCTCILVCVYMYCICSCMYMSCSYIYTNVCHVVWYVLQECPESIPYTLALYHARCMSSSSENRETLSKQVHVHVHVCTTYTLYILHNIIHVCMYIYMYYMNDYVYWRTCIYVDYLSSLFESLCMHCLVGLPIIHNVSQYCMPLIEFSDSIA